MARNQKKCLENVNNVEKPSQYGQNLSKKRENNVEKPSQNN